ncbi:hypothetical protein [Maribacter antarcticus]|uniref:hypothetical protein n=1 Tax=Maribacter antarcticus TaxID=505250 RepID=UPI000478AC3D|nr:hypothetical protein [Maribacter antarcticus]
MATLTATALSLSTSRYFFDSPTQIPYGSNKSYRSIPVSTKTEINAPLPGKFSVRVQNTSIFVDFTVSSKENIFPVRSCFLKRGGSTLNIPEIEIYEEDSYILSITDGNNNHKYIAFENIQDGQLLELDDNDFLNFDSYVAIDVPNQDIEYTYLIVGLEESVDHFRNDVFIYPNNILLGGEDKTPSNKLESDYFNRLKLPKHKTFFSIEMKGISICLESKEHLHMLYLFQKRRFLIT